MRYVSKEKNLKNVQYSQKKIIEKMKYNINIRDEKEQEKKKKRKTKTKEN
jgi:hypothetical protein